ncbi:acetyl-CoA C-acetyltransferase [Loktanella fryxellensis]|uniref:Acetyl-CoA C-acetyltransferase n=1 Tax=Loktanella fryxellensis TaxID=245187 RepID=A0A1H8G5V9_9RHOB|nr:thiolase family protein [Loktanella fryxellensis]SEN39259.1 acetyl-CoA C-acetyltransferase [Loktanella fryxellensis]
MSVIVAARRTAVVPAGGAFASFDFHTLAAPVIRGCLADAGLSGDAVDEVIVGNALGAGGNPARLCALAAGLPERVAGLSIDRQCVSGLDAILLADALIRSGMAKVVIAGGAESASRRPLRLRTFADGRPAERYDQAAFTPWPDRDPDMAQAADRLAQDHGIDRAAQDAWAVRSHALALSARDRLTREIVPLAGVVQDAFTRPLTLRTCARAPIVAGSMTAANAAVAADGAAFVVVVSDALAATLPCNAVRIVGGRTLGASPDLPGLAPVAAIAATLRAAGLRPQDLTAIEIMEAYAVQALACIAGADLDPARVNRHGGALARGHPIGASGAINAVRLVQDLWQTGGTGLAAIAAAGGIGTALLLQG